MMKLEKIERLIELSLISGYIKDDTAPLSLILIANPESGKTKMILKFDAPHTIETTDLSSKPITEKIVPMLRNNELHHILIPDMIKILSHRETTTDSTVAFLNSLMEEGVKKSLFFGQTFEFKERKKCGIITALTFDYFYKVFRKWREIGFISRFIPISFSYGTDTILLINESIEKNVIYSDMIKMKKIAKKKVEINKEISAYVNVESMKAIEQQREEKIVVSVQGGNQKRVPIKIYGFRFHKQMRKLIKAIALSHGRTSVNWEDAKEFKTLIDYVRLPKNPKVI